MVTARRPAREPDGKSGQPYDMEKDITHADMEGLMQAVPR